MSNLPPGPWRVEIEPSPKRFDESTGEPVPPITFMWVKDANNATVTLFMGADEVEKAKANLFSASPDLLDAAIGVMAEINEIRHTDYAPRIARTCIEALENAIAKATGETK